MLIKLTTLFSEKTEKTLLEGTAILHQQYELQETAIDLQELIIQSVS